MSAEIKNHLTEAQAIVKLGGTLTREQGKAFRKLLMDDLAKTKRVVIDLARVDVMDTAIVAVLVEALAKAKQTGVEFFVTHVSGAVEQVLRLLRLDGLFELPVSAQTA